MVGEEASEMSMEAKINSLLDKADALGPSPFAGPAEMRAKKMTIESKLDAALAKADSMNDANRLKMFERDVDKAKAELVEAEKTGKQTAIDRARKRIAGATESLKNYSAWYAKNK